METICGREIAPYVCLGFAYLPGRDCAYGLVCNAFLGEILGHWLISKPYLYEGVVFARTSSN